MTSMTIFKNFSTPLENKSLDHIAKEIASGKYKAEVEEIRALVQQRKSEEVDLKKRQLLAFTPSGVFNPARKLPYLEAYTGIVHLDFDKLSPEQLDSAFRIICTLPCTALCFISPSGNGLKVFIAVNTGQEHHQTAYLQVMKHYESVTGITADSNCKDITRLCFMSYDPKLYVNPENQIFKVQLNTTGNHRQLGPNLEPNPSPYQNEPEEDQHIHLRFDREVQRTNQISQYADGNRNNYVYRLASNCNRAGLAQHEVERLCIERFDLPEAEILQTIRSAYTGNQDEFAKFAKFANPAKLQTTIQPPEQEDLLKATPKIPQELYDQMPDLLREGVWYFSEREKDVFLTGALAVISGCLPNVTGVYSGDEVFPNLYTFSIAPAASGKGVLKYAKMLADVYHSAVKMASIESKRQFHRELQEYNQRIQSKKKGDTSTEDPPVEPNFQLIYIPGNSSHAALLTQLEKNGGHGILCETEADTLSNVLKQEWGSFSDMLRKCFHHEKIASSRKQNNEFLEVETPRLSVALTGTPNQVTGLIASSEDGLFSRFLFYAYNVDQQWKDVSPNDHKINYTQLFKAHSQKVFELVQFLQRKETIIELSREQWDLLNKHGEHWLNEVTLFIAEEAASIVKRSGLILFRMAMIFTALRKFQNRATATRVTCTDQDFDTALRLAQIYLQHSILMFNNLPKQSSATQFKQGDSKRKFFEALPPEFTRRYAVEIGGLFKLSERTVDSMLRTACNQDLVKLKSGHYRKKE
jgi:hypothetical protein